MGARGQSGVKFISGGKRDDFKRLDVDFEVKRIGSEARILGKVDHKEDEVVWRLIYQFDE